MSNRETLSWGAVLEGVAGSVSRDDARRIVEAVSDMDRATVQRHLRSAAPAEAASLALAMAARRAVGEPLQYVVGRWGFRGLDLRVDPRALIPRPETESVVEIALAELAALPAPRLVVDLGTGCAAIALSLVAETTGIEVWATDVSRDALDLARKNANGSAVRTGGPGPRIPRRYASSSAVRFVEGDWFDALPDELRGRIDLVVSNPPYVASADTLPVEVSAWEPREALIAGDTGLECHAAIIGSAPAWLRRPAALVLEIAPHQAEAVRSLCTDAGFAKIAVHPDLTGRPRVLAARLA